MPMPMEYWNASKEFEAFLGEVRDKGLLQTHHQAYHTTRAVLHVFRSHLSVKDALVFANVLPPVIRAIFVEDWDAEAPTSDFPDRRALVAEVRQIRRDHNLAPDSAISDVAHVLREHVETRIFDAVLSKLPERAREFWAG